MQAILSAFDALASVQRRFVGALEEHGDFYEAAHLHLDGARRGV